MDVADMISEIDDYGFTDTTTERKVSKLQEAIWQIEAMEPWPFLEGVTTLSFTGDDGIPLAFPDDFRAALRLKHITGMWRVKPVSIDDFEDIVGGDYSRSGDPRLYYFVGGELNVWPIPVPSTDLIKMYYLKWSPEIDENTLSAEILIPKQYHEAIVLKALVALYVMEDDTDLAVGIENLFEDKIEKMRQSAWMKQYDMTKAIHSVDAEEWDYEDT